MGWIDLKFTELDEATKAREESGSKAAKDHNGRLATAAKAWNQLASALRADIDQYNAHPKAKRRAGIRVMQSPILIEVYWHGETRVLLDVSPRSGEPIFSYSALAFKPSGAQQYSGVISPTSENEFTLTGGHSQSSHIDAAKLSEELLSPVLFP